MSSCGHHHRHVGRSRAPAAAPRASRSDASPATGTVVAFTVLSVPGDEFLNDAPYVYIVVELDGGGRITGWMPTVRTVETDVAIGERVRFRPGYRPGVQFIRESDGRSDHFGSVGWSRAVRTAGPVWLSRYPASVPPTLEIPAQLLPEVIGQAAASLAGPHSVRLLRGQVVVPTPMAGEWRLRLRPRPRRNRAGDRVATLPSQLPRLPDRPARDPPPRGDRCAGESALHRSGPVPDAPRLRPEGRGDPGDPLP